MKLRRLPDTELEVLKALWAAGGETPALSWRTPWPPAAGPATQSTPTWPG